MKNQLYIGEGRQGKSYTIPRGEKGMNGEGRENRDEEIGDIHFHSGDESPIPRESLDTNYTKPGSDFGPSGFMPQTDEFTLVHSDYYGFNMWRGGNGVLYLR